MANEFNDRDSRHRAAVRARFKNICPCCGYETPEGQTIHIVGRTNQITRWLVENSIWGCSALHRKLEMPQYQKSGPRAKLIDFYVKEIPYLYEKLMNVARGISSYQEFGFTEVE